MPVSRYFFCAQKKHHRSGSTAVVLIQRKEIREIGMKKLGESKLTVRSDGNFRVVMHRTPVCACRAGVIQVDVCRSACVLAGKIVFVGQIRVQLFHTACLHHLVELA